MNKSVDIKQYLINEQNRIDEEEKYDKNQRYGQQELIGTQVNIVSLFNENNMYKIRKMLNPKANYKCNYIILDSVNRLINSNLYKMSWQYINDAVFQQGTVNTKGPLRDIVGIRLYPIRVAQNIDSSGIYNISTTLLIDEFVSQSFICNQKRNFHFMLRNTINPSLPGIQTTISYNELTPVNDGYFWFRKPFTTISTLTISLANPLVPIPIPLPTVIVTCYSFSVANPTVITTPVPSGFNNNNTIIISNFTTLDPVADAAQIAAVNSSSGNVITVIDSTHFSIPVNLSAITAYTVNNSGPLVTIVNNSMRVIIPMEVIYIEPDSTEIDN